MLYAYGHYDAEGFLPEDIDTVILTHAHGDHIGGSVDASGDVTFAQKCAQHPENSHFSVLLPNLWRGLPLALKEHDNVTVFPELTDRERVQT